MVGFVIFSVSIQKNDVLHVFGMAKVSRMKPKSSDLNKRESRYTIKGTYGNISKSNKNIFYLAT